MKRINEEEGQSSTPSFPMKGRLPMLATFVSMRQNNGADWAMTNTIDGFFSSKMVGGIPAINEFMGDSWARYSVYKTNPYLTIDRLPPLHSYMRDFDIIN